MKHRSRIIAACFLLALVSGFAAEAGEAAGEADWPQWRGPGGRGVAPEGTTLPETWAPDAANVRWKTEIPGDGISSPAVSDGQVFLTTAAEGTGGGTRELLVRIAIAALALFFVVSLWRRRGSGEPIPRPVLYLSCAFVLLALVLVFAPQVLLKEGIPGRSWRVGGGLGLLGLVTAFGFAREDSRWRLAGAAAALAGTVFLYVNSPTGPLGPISFDRRVTHQIPALGLAFWYVLRYLKVRRAAAPAGGGHRPLPALALALLAPLVFVPINYFVGLQRVVVCLDLESGERLWQTPVFSAPPEQKWPRNSYATPTPVIDGDRVFAYFGPGLASLDRDGKIRWVKRFPEYTRHTRYGAATSPVTAGGAVIVVQESEMFQGGPPSWIAAFDQDTGDVRWRITPPEAHDSYGTPMLVAAADADHLLTATWHHLVAYDAATGERLWSHPNSHEQMVTSPAREGDLLALSGGVEGERSLVVLRLPGEEPGAGVEELWVSRRGVAAIASPVVYRGMVFTITDGGILTCYEAESGRVLWRARLKGEYFASLAAGDGKLYATNSEGATTVIAAEPKHREIAVNELGEEVFASPAMVDGGLLIRTAGHLVLIGLEPGRSDAPPAPEAPAPEAPAPEAADTAG